MPAVMEKKKSVSKSTTLEEFDASLAAAAGEVEDEGVCSELASRIQADWQAARNARAELIDEMMLRNLRQWRGQYDPEKLAAIASMPGGSKLYPMITRGISTDLHGQIKEILSQNDPMWSLDVEPESELPPDVELSITHSAAAQSAKETTDQLIASGQPYDEQSFMQAYLQKMSETRAHAQTLLTEEAKTRAEGMNKKIQTQWEEGGGPAAAEECLVDYCRNVISVMKWAIRNEKRIKYKKNRKGKVKPEVATEPSIMIWRRPPEAIYPLLGTTNIRTGGLIDFHRLSRAEINKFIGLPGYNDEEIRSVLREYDEGGLEEWVSQTITSDVATIMKEVDPLYQSTDPLIDALNYWGSFPGSVLLDYGMDESRITDPDIEYEVEAWLIGTHVIRCVINPDRLGRHPYSATGYGMEPGQFWYTSLCEEIRAPQMLCCDAFLDLQRNMNLASGPIPEVDSERVPNAGVWEPEPWTPIVSTHDQTDKGPAVKFNNIPMQSAALTAVYGTFKGEAYQIAGIPNPNAPVQAGQTLGGASMAQTAKNLRIQLHVDNFENKQIAPIVEDLFNYNMQFDEDESIKGNAKVRIRGTHSLVAKELKLKRRQERIAAMNNPTDLQITGLEGRKNDIEDMLREEGSDPSRILNGNLNPAQTGQAAPGAKPAEMDAAGISAAGREFSTVSH